MQAYQTKQLIFKFRKSVDFKAVLTNVKQESFSLYRNALKYSWASGAREKPILFFHPRASLIQSIIFSSVLSVWRENVSFFRQSTQRKWRPTRAAPALKNPSGLSGLAIVKTSLWIIGNFSLVGMGKSKKGLRFEGGAQIEGRRRMNGLSRI